MRTNDLGPRTEGRGVPVGGWRFVECSVCGRVGKGGRMTEGGVMIRPHATPATKGDGSNCPGHLTYEHAIVTPLWHKLCNRMAFFHRFEMWRGDLDPENLIAARGYGRPRGPGIRCGHCAMVIESSNDLSLRREPNL